MSEAPARPLFANLLDKSHAHLPFNEAPDAPVAALTGLSEADAEALQRQLGIRTIRDLAEHPLVRAAQTIVKVGRSPLRS